MKAEAHPLKTIFGKDARYVVPLYQRPYVWTREDKWVPLWEDVLLLVRSLHAGEDVPPHFLGAIVLDHQFGTVGDLEVRHIIDGQQRLITLQLLLAAAARVAETQGCEKSGRVLRKLTGNNPDLFIEPDHEFKVWPTNVDRAAFRAVMRNGAVTSNDGSLLAECYRYLESAIADWAVGLSDSVSDGFDALTRSVRDHMRLVVIDLEQEDNAQIIFETLNARTTPLLAIDLVKNLVFRRAELEGANLDELYVKQWRPFDEDTWRREVRQGRLLRPRAEIFLMHWLSMKRAEETPAHHLYPVFRRLIEARGAPTITEIIEEFAQDARTFNSFEHQPPGSRERTFFERLAILDVTTIYPLLVFLFRQSPNVLPDSRRRRALEILESWLVRRMLCRLTPKNYNRYFLDLLRLVQRNVGHADEVLRDELRAASADTNAWPNDLQIRATLVDSSLYYRVAGHRIIAVLTAIELALRQHDSKAENVSLPSGLTIEHVLPQKWSTNWSLNQDDPKAVLNRDLHVNRLGNLTLATPSLNPGMSNAEWKTKRSALRSHSLLLLNAQLCDRYPDLWDESTIDKRSAELVEEITEIWPGPAARNWYSN